MQNEMKCQKQSEEVDENTRRKSFIEENLGELNKIIHDMVEKQKSEEVLFFLYAESLSYDVSLVRMMIYFDIGGAENIVFSEKNDLYSPKSS